MALRSPPPAAGSDGAIRPRFAHRQRLFEDQSQTAVDLNAFYVSTLVLAETAGIILALFVAFSRIYKIFQLTALAWDTDGDGVVDFSEVVTAVKIITAGWLIRARAKRSGVEVPATITDRKIEWRSATYSVLWSVGHINLMQLFIVVSLIYYPSSVRIRVLAPCNSCADFRAVVARQLGTVLGLQALQTYPPPLPQLGVLNGSSSNTNATSSSTLDPPSPPISPVPAGVPHFRTNRSYGYNCSHPTSYVEPLYLSGVPAAPSIMGQPIPNGLYSAWPRITCPSDDDADGLRFLYPECDELLPCEVAGGAEIIEGNETGCARYMPTDRGYSIDDHYRPLGYIVEPWILTTSAVCTQYNGTNGTIEDNCTQVLNSYPPPAPPPPGNATNVPTPGGNWSALPSGRALPPTPCLRDFKTAWGKLGLFRLFSEYYRAVLPPIFSICLIKLLCVLALRLPFMNETRKRNERLQRTALKRKAEVRRMTEGGQEFAVKRAARGSLVDSSLTQEVVKEIRQSASYSAVTTKKIEAGNKLLTNIRSPS